MLSILRERIWDYYCLFYCICIVCDVKFGLIKVLYDECVIYDLICMCSL